MSMSNNEKDSESNATKRADCNSAHPDSEDQSCRVADGVFEKPMHESVPMPSVSCDNGVVVESAPELIAPPPEQFHTEIGGTVNDTIEPVNINAEVGQLDRIEARVISLTGELQIFAREANKAIQEETEKFRRALDFLGNRSFLNELLDIYDDINRLCLYYSQVETIDPKDVFDNFDGIRMQYEEALRRSGITKISVEGLPLDLTRHRAVRAVSISDPSRHREIAEEVRAGFESPAGVVRPADVSILRYQSNLNNKPLGGS
jgi:molecular chaperone GrpE (heat shock protein)